MAFSIRDNIYTLSKFLHPILCYFLKSIRTVLQCWILTCKHHKREPIDTAESLCFDYLGRARSDYRYSASWQSRQLFLCLFILSLYSWRTVMRQNVLDGVFTAFLKRAEA